MTSRGLFGKKPLAIEERTRDIGAPADEQVVVKIHACGVCGTDINFVRDWAADPMPLGHEIAAEVMEVGRHVTTVKPGDRVIVEDCTLCGVCEDCKSGKPWLCRSMYSMEGQPGLGQYMTVRFNSLNRFDGMDYRVACLTEPLAVSLTSVENAEIPLGGSVAVLGVGPLGLMAARLAKLRGAGFVAITGKKGDTPRERARLDLARSFGADLVIETEKQDVEEEIKKRFPKGVERVIVSSPPESMVDAFKIIRFGGIITPFGLHFGGRNTVPLDVNDLIFRKITIRPTFAEPAINFPVSLRLLREGLVDAKAIVSHTFGLDEARAIMQAVVEGTKPIIKAVALPNG